MSRNLGRSFCDCGRVFKLSDFIGKPIEFRRYSHYVPQMGCKMECDRCGEVYFAYLHREDRYWDERSIQDGSWKDASKNPLMAGRFAVERDSPILGKSVSQTGCFTIDLSYYDTYNDEKADEKPEKPWHLCEDDAEDVEWVWKSPEDWHGN